MKLDWAGSKAHLGIAFAFFLPIAAAVAGKPVLVLNPYAGIDWQAAKQHKGNFHTHSKQSDGEFSPDQVIDEYHERGYHILAITDHNGCTFPWQKWERKPEDLGMVAVPGNELSRHHHALSLFSDFASSGSNLDTVLKELTAHSKEGLAVIAHPAMHWPKQFGPAPGLLIPLATPLRQVTRGDFTVEAWVRTTDAGRHILIGNYTGSDHGALNLELHVKNRVRVYVQPTGKKRIVDINIPADRLGINTRDGQWHHLAGIREKKTVSLYLDGKLAGTAPDTAEDYDLWGKYYYVGRDSRTDGTILNGDLDLVRLWGSALSAAEVAQLAAGKTPGKGKALARRNLLLEYDFETSSGVPLRENTRIEPVVDDTAGHPQGPFPAIATATTPVWCIPNTSGATRRVSERVGSFRPRSGAQRVTKAALQHYVELYQKHDRLVGIEVVNGTRPLKEYPLDRELWDKLLGALMPTRPVWGLASDDMHAMKHLAHDWLVVPSATLDQESIRQAMLRGAYYFSTERIHGPAGTATSKPPQIQAISHDPKAGTLTVQAMDAEKPLPNEAYQWISLGRLVHTGPRLDYASAPGIGNYVRLEITGPGGTTFTNPFGFGTE